MTTLKEDLLKAYIEYGREFNTLFLAEVQSHLNHLSPAITYAYLYKMSEETNTPLPENYKKDTNLNKHDPCLEQLGKSLYNTPLLEKILTTHPHNTNLTIIQDDERSPKCILLTVFNTPSPISSKLQQALTHLEDNIPQLLEKNDLHSLVKTLAVTLSAVSGVKGCPLEVAITTPTQAYQITIYKINDLIMSRVEELHSNTIQPIWLNINAPPSWEKVPVLKNLNQVIHKAPPWAEKILRRATSHLDTEESKPIVLTYGSPTPIYQDMNKLKGYTKTIAVGYDFRDFTLVITVKESIQSKGSKKFKAKIPAPPEDVLKLPMNSSFLIATGPPIQAIITIPLPVKTVAWLLNIQPTGI